MSKSEYVSLFFTLALIWFSFDQGVFAGAAGAAAFLVSSGAYLGGGTLILGAMTGDNQRKGLGLIVIVMVLAMATKLSVPFDIPSLAVILGGVAGFLASLGAPSLGEAMTFRDWAVLLGIIIFGLALPSFLT